MPVLNFDKILDWKDFPGRNAQPPYAEKDILAFTKINWLPQNTKVVKVGGNVPFESIDLNISFDKEASWVLVDKKTTRLLKHEQVHFDIAALIGVEMYPHLAKNICQRQSCINDCWKRIVGKMAIAIKRLS